MAPRNSAGFHTISDSRSRHRGCFSNQMRTLLVSDLIIPGSSNLEPVALPSRIDDCLLPGMFNFKVECRDFTLVSLTSDVNSHWFLLTSDSTENYLTFCVYAFYFCHLEASTFCQSLETLPAPSETQICVLRATSFQTQICPEGP